jgi:hypothetical protein
MGMLASTASAAADSRPTAFDSKHSTTGDCGSCHVSTPTFATNLLPTATKPAGHIPTNAVCAQCHTTAGNFALYSATGVHQNVSGCLSCHASSVANTFLNVTIVSTPANHIPIGSLDCNGSGCHTTTNVNPGGFNIGTASINAPTLTVPGHTTVATAVGTCQTCHETAPYMGMVAGTASTAGDSRPVTALDANHPTSGDCTGCHTTAPTFGGDIMPGAKPANHIPTSAPCIQCHTTPNNYALYSVTGAHQGVTDCLSCHGPTVGPFANLTIVTTPGNHIPIGSLDCNGSGCHSTGNVNAGGFKLGTANISSPTLTVTGHTTATGVGIACATCHETAPYMGMLASTASAAADSRPTAFDSKHSITGDCGGCHVTTPTFATNLLPTATKPAGHIPTTAVCAQCHTTAGNFALYSVTGVHQNVSSCLSCHASSVANTFLNVTIVSTPANHIPIGTLDCNGSGCHTTTNVNTGGFNIGTASINAPTLTVAGHTTAATAVGTCQTCHETAPYMGMLSSTTTAAGDSRPTAFDKNHPTTGDCTGCHTTTPTFAGDVTGGGKPTNHIPTSAVCTQCHTTAGNYAAYSVTGVHQGVTGCVSCHASSVATTFANITIVTNPSNHIPFGNLDCNGSGCHSTANVNPGGFNIGAASINAPTLTVPGHTTVATAVGTCQTCHETAPYMGMLASSATTAGDSRPTAFDKNHPTSGDCTGCHTTTPTFAGDIMPGAKPANHIPTSAPCTQCHTTPNNYALYSVTATHQGVTDCLSCHGPTVGPFANLTIVTTPGNHIPIGSLDCNGSGCHSMANVNAGGFNIGTASINTPTLTVAGHTTATGVGIACATCHETAPYMGMLASTASAAADSRPTAFDSKHSTTGDCGSCHVTTPTFATNLLPTATKPAGHIPTTAVCAQCHTTAGNFALYSVTGVHQNVSSCLSCHASSVASTFLNVTIVSTPANHIPIGTLDCNGSGCHTTTNVNAGGFNIGAASINAPTLTVAGHTTVATAVGTCQSCHETASYMGMVAGTASTAGDSRPVTALDKTHPTTGDCMGCHTTTPTFANDQTGNAKPANHIPTSAACGQCHLTAGNYALYSVSGTHQGVTGCVSCHGSSVATTFANITIVANPSNHIPFGNLDCNGSGCHSAANVNPGGFNIGTANINTPTLTVAGHTTVATAVTGCQACHETAPYVGMLATSATTAADSRPAALDKNHPTTGDCIGCHTTTPTFAIDQTGNAKPANHIPTSAACSQCHTTAGNYTLYSVTGTHQGVTGCVSCHGSSVATTFANITIVANPSNHIPFGSLDCNGSGCHTANNLNPGGFNIGTANINTPTLTVAGHNTVVTAVASCQSCHETAPYMGMLTSTGATAGDSRPTALDKSHPTTGDCMGCHTTTPTFAVDQTGNAKPANHIPTSAACSQCHTTAGNYTLYSVTGTHQGVTGCVSCHGSSVATTFANVTIVTNPSTHIPFGSVDCNGSGCHTTTNVNPGGFNIGTANINTPTLTVAGHNTVASPVPSCQTCHEGATYLGMLASSSSTAGDSRPTALDKNHPTTGDCMGCHTTTPTFAVDQTGNAKPANHIPTSAACSQCHTTAGNYALYSVTGTHQGVTGCVSCHGSSVATTFANVTIVANPSNHIPFGSLDCNGSGCHTTNNVNPGGFNIGTASISTPTLNAAGHTTVGSTNGVSGCQTCHQSAPYLGMMVGTSMSAQGDDRPMKYDSGHPTSGDCNSCHTTTPTFSTNQNGSSAKPSNHIPTNAACSQCHTTAGNYGAYVMGATGHTGITNNCAQCHAYGLSFYNMAPPTLVEPPSGATGHIPAVPPNGTSTIACELCHSPSVFTTFSGTVMKHAYVTALKCDSCHEYGMTWKTNTGVTLWTRPSPSHHAGQDCGGSGCHTSRDKYAVRSRLGRQGTATTTMTVRPGAAGGAAAASTAPAAGVPGPTGGAVSRAPASGAPATAVAPSIGVAPPSSAGTPATAPAIAPALTPASPVAAASFSHASVAGKACVTCHATASGSGKSATHIATRNTCQTCHTTLAWLPVVRVDHTQVLGSCASCHNGMIAKGKSSSHLPTTTACESCHTTMAWTPARFDHAAVAPHTCTTCHNSVRAIGMPRMHIPTTQQCDACHGTLAWSPVKVDHSALTASCASCHNNIGAVGLPPKHMTTQVDCASCHAYPDWSATHFRHASAAYPGTHRASLECTSCHTANTDKVPWPSAADAGTCGGCHAKDFKPAAHPKTVKGVDYTAHELANCTGACHVYSDTAQSTIIRSLPGPHHRVTDATFKR